MTRIIVVRGTGASGVSLRPGEIAEVSAEDAQILIGLGKARAYVEPELPAIDPEMIETRDPVAETRDPMPDESQGQGEALLGAPRMHGLTTERAAALVEKSRRKPR